ncbi:regulatory LuxR family protein [Hoeflea marina]|uniref:Regulatory LuxR family protein n=1 Tax=Hoeflea marina TaxID=274592 RepID=A0A317PD81_9HYPH|nr:LuxR C-terminal-related transcriptional regulator [Hoeflea marina]PWV95365.1 regulatory LuxR family protein [Hoeflea marina]
MDLSSNPGTVPLTRTEMKCLTMIAEGYTEEEIGRELTLSKEETTAVLNVVVIKLGSPNRMAAIGKAMRLGMISCN